MKGIQAISRTSFCKIVREVKLRLHSVSSQMKLRVIDSFCTKFWGVHGHPAQPYMAESDSSSNPPEIKVNTDSSVAIEAAAAAIARESAILFGLSGRRLSGERFGRWNFMQSAIRWRWLREWAFGTFG